MQNLEDEISKTAIFSRRGFGGKRKSKTEIDEKLLFKKLMKSPNTRLQERWNTWHEYANQLATNMRDLHEKMCSAVFTDMIAHLKIVNEMLNVEREKIEDGLDAAVQLLPVACLNTGINLPDHDTTFSLLSKKISDEISDKIVRLSALNCSSIKHAFGAIAEQLGMQRAYGTDITIWNIEQHISDTTIEEIAPPIILIFEDSEEFSPMVFSKLLEVLSAAQSKLKIIIILGIATDSSMVNDILPYEALSLLNMKHFSCLTAPKYLQEFLDANLMTENSFFQISSMAFEFLLIQFLHYDFSVSNFGAGLHFVSLQHYKEQPFSFLCTNKETGLKRISSMTSTEISQIKKLDSVKYLEIDSKNDLVEYYKKHFDEEKIVHKLLRALYKCQDYLIEKPLGRRPRENYIRSLHQKLTDTSEFRKFMMYLSLLDQDKFVKIVNEFYQEFESDPKNDFTNYLEQINMRLMEEDLTELAEEAKDEDENDDQQDEKKAKNAYELQKQLRSKAHARSKPKTKYQYLRQDFCDVLQNLCSDYFYAGRMKKPLSEIFFFDNKKLLSNRFNPSLTKILHRAMSNPYLYLKDEKMKAEIDSIHDALPDISIAFKLFAQCGNMINLADWLDSFLAVKEYCKARPYEMEARFMQCAHDLQFIGLLKPTQRKTDHVQKCTWAL